MAAKRFLTYFGVAIPPFKENKLGAGTTTIRFVLTGKTPSKKNSSQAIVRRKEARAYITAKAKEGGGMITDKDAQIAIGMTNAKIMPNLAYNEWKEEQRPIIEKQREFWMNRLQDKGLFFPLSKASMSIRFYFANDYFIDSISKQESVQDLLTDLAIIQDDNYKVLNPIYTESAQYKDELVHNIALVSLTFKLKPEEGYIKPKHTNSKQTNSNKFIKNKKEAVILLKTAN